MKKAIFGIVALTLLLASCNKSSSSSNSWTFKGTTYNTTTCANVVGVLEAVTTNGTVSVVFYNNGPTVNTTYTVGANGNPGSTSQVGVTLTVGTNNPVYYSSTGGNGSNQSVQVSVSSTGKLTATGSGIMLSNNTNPSDSATVSLNITQQ